MSARKRKALPARLSPDTRLPCDPKVNGHSTGNGNGDEPEVGTWSHVSGDVMESIRSVIGSARTVEDKQRRLNAMIYQLQVIRDQLTRQQHQQQQQVNFTRDVSCL